jgi:hypothetical protein
MAELRCPTCFTLLEGEDAWTDDPILTKGGLSGAEYKGFTAIKAQHIIELQDIRRQHEIGIGIPSGERTQFTKVEEDGDLPGFFVPDKQHIRELRESTEKILEALDLTLEDYFNYDENGTEYNVGNHQTDWYTPDLDNWDGHVRAIHIEDLRHYLPTLVPARVSITARQSNALREESIVPILYMTKGSHTIHDVNAGQRSVEFWSGYTNPNCGLITNEWDNIIWYDETREAWFVGVEPGGFRFTFEQTQITYDQAQALKQGTTINDWEIDLQATLDEPKALTSYDLEEHKINMVEVEEGHPYQQLFFLYSADFLENRIGKYKDYSLEPLLGSGETIPDTFIAEEQEVTPLEVTNDVTKPYYESRNLNTLKNTAWMISAYGCVIEWLEQPALVNEYGSWFEYSNAYLGDKPQWTSSLFIPKNWNLSKLENYKQTRIEQLQFVGIDTFSFVSLLDTATNYTENSFGRTSQFITGLHIWNNDILTRDDGVEFVAEDRDEFFSAQNTSGSISFPAEAIDASFEVYINGEQWEKVDDLSEFTEDDHVFKVDSQTVEFIGGIGSAWYYQELLIVYYSNEVAVENYYATGYIILSENRHNETFYVKYNYYNCPHFVVEYKNYDVDYTHHSSYDEHGVLEWETYTTPTLEYKWPEYADFDKTLHHPLE